MRLCLKRAKGHEVAMLGNNIDIYIAIVCLVEELMMTSPLCTSVMERRPQRDIALVSVPLLL